MSILPRHKAEGFLKPRSFQFLRNDLSASRLEDASLSAKLGMEGIEFAQTFASVSDFEF
jgi:hypothetical protein